MPPRSASKYSNLEFLEQARTDNYVSAGGIEYVAEELDSLITEKAQRRADAQLKLWVNPEPVETSDDGLIEALMGELKPNDEFFEKEVEMKEIEIKHFHLFCGLGGGAKGFNAASATVNNMTAKFRCIGGIDVDKAAIRDFDTLAQARGTAIDMFDRDQYRSFHGHEPPGDWREATPQDIQAAAGHERPNIVFLSAPCKGFSGLLSETRSKSEKYQALNRLTLRGVWLMLEAFGDDPPELILFENVPRIATRGRPLLDQIGSMLRHYGYAVNETKHDCGEIGGLGQSRKRFLLVARHKEKVPPFLYEPIKRNLRSVGEVIGALPLPGMELGGPLHRLPSLQWKTWVRLAFVEAGGDWRTLNRLSVEDGYLKDYLLVPDMHRTVMGVNKWDDPMGTVTGNARAGTGAFSVADPRYSNWHPGASTSKMRVTGFDQPSRTVVGAGQPASGALSVADPRFQGAEYGQYGVKKWSGTASTVTSQRSPGQGSFSVADPRLPGTRHNNVFRVIRYAETSAAVTGGTGPSAGGLAVADPRMSWGASRPNYDGGGHYGIVPWSAHAGAISAAAEHDNGRWSVADPRTMPTADQKLVTRIIAEDGTWHRPFTTLELAALQGLVDPEAEFNLDGASDGAHRERIGNAVPAPAATAIASEMGRTLLLAWSGETFALGDTPIWVRDVAVALSVSGGAEI
jgi:site-specific DNA-cytosine methylase